MEVLFEKDIENGKIHGFTDNYIRVAISYEPDLVNKLLKVHLNSVRADGVMDGTLCSVEVVADR